MGSFLVAVSGSYPSYVVADVIGRTELFLNPARISPPGNEAAPFLAMPLRQKVVDAEVCSLATFRQLFLNHRPI